MVYIICLTKGNQFRVMREGWNVLMNVGFHHAKAYFNKWVFLYGL